MEITEVRQSATFATPAIAEVGLRFNFLYQEIAELALRNKAFKICCGLIALRFKFFFFFSVNRTILFLEQNFGSFQS